MFYIISGKCCIKRICSIYLKQGTKSKLKFMTRKVCQLYLFIISKLVRWKKKKKKYMLKILNTTTLNI